MIQDPESHQVAKWKSELICDLHMTGLSSYFSYLLRLAYGNWPYSLPTTAAIALVAMVL